MKEKIMSEIKIPFRCTTHHNACDCREYILKTKIEKLEKESKLKIKRRSAQYKEGESQYLKIIEKLEKELHQQRFNNKHNLSIDQVIADKITALERESHDFRELYGQASGARYGVAEENEKLKKENALLTKSNEFYCNIQQWDGDEIMGDLELYFLPHCESREIGGKLARQVKQEIEEMK